MVGWRWRGFAGSLAGGGARGAARRSVRWARRAPGAACGWGGGGLRWARFAQTEVAEKSSNPLYLRTITIR